MNGLLIGNIKLHCFKPLFDFFVGKLDAFK